MTRLATALIFFLIAILLGMPPLLKHISRTFNFSTQESFSAIMLLTNLFVIGLMILSILFNNESTRRQIDAVKYATLEQIATIEKTTREHLDNIENADKQRKSALLSALLLEYKENIRNIEEIVGNEEMYVDPTDKGGIPHNKFSFEAYQANLNNATIDDNVLIDKIVQVYSGLKLWQAFLDMAKTSMLSKESRVKTLRNAIIQMKENLNKLKETQAEIKVYIKNYDSK